MELTKHQLKYADWQAKKTFDNLKRDPLFELDDCKQICRIGLLKAVSTLDTSKSSFSTYAHWKMRGEINHNIHRPIHRRLRFNDTYETVELNAIHYDTSENSEREGIDLNLNLNMSIDSGKILSIIKEEMKHDPRLERMLMLKYHYGKTYNEIMECMGISLNEFRSIKRKVNIILKKVKEKYNVKEILQ